MQAISDLLFANPMTTVIVIGLVAILLMLIISKIADPHDND